MKFLKKVKKFIKKIFVDYNFINQLIEDHSIKYLSEMSQVETELKKENEKVQQRIEEKVDKKIEELNNHINNEFYRISKDIEQIKCKNIELQNIRYDKQKKNILIIDFYGAPNLGDELMLETILEYLEDVPNTKITILLADNPGYNIDKYKEVRFIHYPKTLCDFNTLAEQYDYFIFGGGAILSDKNYKKESSYQYDLGTILVKLSIRAIAFHKKLIFFGLSASSEIKDVEYLEKLEYIIKNASYFSVRDKYTKKFLTEKMGQEIEKYVIFNHDIVLANKKIYHEIEKNNNMDKLNIGIVWISNDNKIENLKKTLQAINQYKKCNINLIPFYEYCNIDTKFYYQIVDSDYENLTINIEKYPENMEKTMEVFLKNDIIIGMRYHSILLAHALVIPCLSICYDIHEDYEYKIKYLNEVFEKEEALSYQNISYDRLIERIKLLCDRKNEDKSIQLSRKIKETSQKQIQEVMDKLLKEND